MDKEIEIDKALFLEIKAAQEDGVSSNDVAQEMELPLENVNVVFYYDNFSDYLRERGTQKQKDEKNQERVNPAKAGYYRALVAKKAEENEGLKEQRGWLLEQVYFLRKAVAFLETRKNLLENGIMELEKQLTKALPMIEQLEDNNGFENVSKKVEKKNK